MKTLSSRIQVSRKSLFDFGSWILTLLGLFSMVTGIGILWGRGGRGGWVGGVGIRLMALLAFSDFLIDFLILSSCLCRFSFMICNWSWTERLNSEIRRLKQSECLKFILFSGTFKYKVAQPYLSVISLSFSSKEAEWCPFLLIGNFPRETPLLLVEGFIFGLKIGCSSATMLSECVAQELLGRGSNST